MAKVEKLLDESVEAQRYVIRSASQKLDLSKIDFEKLKADFAKTMHKFTEAEKLKRILNGQVAQLTRLNKTRLNFAQQLERMIQEYNSGSANIETLFAELVKFGQDLDAEGQRAAREGLSEEELAVFDLVVQGDPELSRRDEQAVKSMARQLLAKLKSSALVLDWRKKQQIRARVRQTIKQELRQLGAGSGELDSLLGSLYAHIHEAYTDRDHSIYE